MPEKEQESTEPAADFGASTHGSFAYFDRASSSWRTCQRCLVEGSDEFSETWPRAGTMRSGIAYRRAPSAPIIGEIGYSCWPTPTAIDSTGRGQRAPGSTENHLSISLEYAVNRAMWPTPRSTDGTHGGRVTPRKSREGGNLIEAVSSRTEWATPTAHPRTHSPRKVDHGEQLANQVGGSLNPTWVEWLMGFPAEWTALSASETPSSRKSRKSSGGG